LEKNLYKFLFRITCLGVLILLFKIISPYTFDDWFPIDEITISGDYKYLERDQVMLVAENYLEGNFFTLNINLLRKGMKKLPWVKDVDIYRKWPNRITMIISQHKPIARYGMQGLINEEGEFFGAAYEDYLPIFYGPREEIPILTIKYYSFNEILKEELIKIHKITFTKKKDWEIISTDGMKIKLNNIRPEYDLKRFIKNYQNVLKSLNKRVTYVDLRYRDGFSIGTKN
jgi:cell division protein FtsQ